MVSDRSIVLVEDSQQQQKTRAAGADVALIKGHPAAKLIAAIEGVIGLTESGPLSDDMVSTCVLFAVTIPFFGIYA